MAILYYIKIINKTDSSPKDFGIHFYFTDYAGKYLI